MTHCFYYTVETDEKGDLLRCPNEAFVCQTFCNRLAMCEEHARLFAFENIDPPRRPKAKLTPQQLELFAP